ncbi:MAG: hypothetical protein WKG03_05935 [Telluria sp.]
MTPPNNDLLPFAAYFRPGFLLWLAINEPIYRQFEAQTLTLIAEGWQHFSARTIVEEIRHYTRLREAGACSFKIDGNMAPDLARAFAVRYPEHVRMWEYRRADSSDFLAAIEARQQPGDQLPLPLRAA